jgi:hypothetical protein
MKLKKNIATSESGFVFNPVTGDSFSTNPLGTEILFMLKDGKAFEEISALVLEKYDVEQVVFEKDYDDLMAQLKAFNLLEI